MTALSVRDLNVFFEDDAHRRSSAVRDVCFDLERGKCTCLVGESGCGKSLTARACLGILPAGAKAEGNVSFDGRNLLSLPEKALQHIRGRDISMIFQEPMTALNPVLTVGDQAAEPLRVHLGMKADAAKQRVIELFHQVGIPAPEDRYKVYPHELSGGMRQRVMIAMALTCEPQVLLADEPTTALDPTIQGQILSVLQLQAQAKGMALLLITHDLGVVAQMATNVGVMYAGSLVEFGSLQDVFTKPLHPYTQGLMASAPTKDALRQQRLPAIPGSVPSLGSLPAGCPFHPRCQLAETQCAEKMPPESCREGHRVRCWLAEKIF